MAIYDQRLVGTTGVRNAVLLTCVVTKLTEMSAFLWWEDCTM